jgi:hypothetical protein
VEEANTLRKVFEDTERSGWRETVNRRLSEHTSKGIGCPEIECAGLTQCLTAAAKYISTTLDAMSDPVFCPRGFNSDDGGCDESQRLAQLSLQKLATEWVAVLPGLSHVMNTNGRQQRRRRRRSAEYRPPLPSYTLEDALEVADKARALAENLSPTEMCEGRTIVLDSSKTTNQNGGGGRGRGRYSRKATEAPKRRAEPAVAADTNQLLGQFATYSSLCGGSAAALTDGEFFATSVGGGGGGTVGGEGGSVAGENRVVFESCEENAPSIEVATIEPSYISTVRVGKQCVDGASFDPTVPGLRVKVRTSAGVFSCGTLADATDAACMEGGTMFWERRCDTLGAPIAARAVVVVREAPCTPMGAEHCAAVGPPKVRFLTRSGWRQRKAAAPSYAFGSVILTEVEALGRPVAVANVLLGQAASSTSQCHERPTYVPLGQHGTQFPSVTGSRVFDTGSEHACLEACQADDVWLPRRLVR